MKIDWPSSQVSRFQAWIYQLSFQPSVCSLSLFKFVSLLSLLPLQWQPPFIADVFFDLFHLLKGVASQHVLHHRFAPSQKVSQRKKQTKPSIIRYPAISEPLDMSPLPTPSSQLSMFCDAPSGCTNFTELPRPCLAGSLASRKQTHDQ